VLLKEIMDDMEISLTESKAHIYAEGLPVVNGYLSGLKSLFQNLISNAVKYRKAGTEPIIKITAVSKEKEWLFAISDNGIGIEEVFYNKLFIIFQRLHNKNEYSGTGIGLARCKKIVELHGGRIWLESAIDEGSTFYFTISKLI
jgi:light-regulated signal transduction histidine kinase (bacteriophytochrome)